MARICFVLSILIFYFSNSIYGDDGKCLPDCGDNEVALKCKKDCPSDTCMSLYVKQKCVADQPCKPGCTCKDGYKRDNVTCIPQSKCRPLACINDPNAIAGCGPRRTCADLKEENNADVSKVRLCKIYGCNCKEGYVYDGNIDKCVLPKKCTKQCTKSHEEYTSCYIAECKAKTCDDLGEPIACPGIIPPCKDGCICKNGFVRDCKGDCIATEECPNCGGDQNAVSKCGNHCHNRELPINATACSHECFLNKCECRDGYVYSECDKKCIKKPDTKQCIKSHEEYTSCYIDECKAKICDDLGEPLACSGVGIPPCKDGCICENGFVRNCKGDCIATEECPSCGGDKNAVSKCGNHCHNRELPINVTACSHECFLNKCECRDGYVYSECDKKCIEKTDTEECGDNEEYNKCGSSCPQPSCDNPKQEVCYNKQCLPGCFCKDKFVRNYENKCVALKDCPKCDKANEVYRICYIDQCMQKTCEQLGKKILCPKVKLPCKDGCICKDGYLRNSKGICIPIKECPSCGGDPNAESGCGNHCGNRCSDYNKKVICDLVCNVYGCDCKKGYVYDENKRKCVKPCECTQCEDPNSHYLGCPGKEPCPATCERTEPFPCKVACRPGCECNDGYVLAGPEAKCVKIEECKHYAKCSANETFVECNHRCPDVVCPTSDAIIMCRPPNPCPGGCGCKPGYRYNENDKCILASECPRIKCTRENEHWESCSSPSLAEHCNHRESGEDDSGICVPGCICNKGFYRNAAHNCVPAEECPEE